MTGDGRGRPPVFDQERQRAFLDLIAAGARIGEAATKVGIDRRTATYLAARDADFAQRFTNAKARGRDNRIPHGTPNGYDNYGCRKPCCRTASSKARTKRRNRDREPEAEVVPLPTTGGKAPLLMLAEVS